MLPERARSGTGSGMPVSVVVGGQFGSEGKGKVSLEMVRRDQSVAAVVRVGGTNSGHTGIGADRNAYALSQLPAAALDRPVQVILPSGSFIDLAVLDRELKLLGLGPDSVAHPSRCTCLHWDDA
jgi:adenylosuccinate synthase